MFSADMIFNVEQIRMLYLWKYSARELGAEIERFNISIVGKRFITTRKTNDKGRSTGDNEFIMKNDGWWRVA